jgi:hypothetical protein
LKEFVALLGREAFVEVVEFGQRKALFHINVLRLK